MSMNLMKRRLFSLAVMLGLFLVSSQLLAAKDFKVAIVDFQKALNSVEEGKAFVAELKKDAEGKHKDLEKREKEIQALQKELEELQAKAASGLLKPEALDGARKKQMEYQTKLEAFMKLRQEGGQQIAEKEQGRRIEMIGRMRTLVNDMGRQEGFDMVLEVNESGVVYVATHTDLTEKLIQQYNKKYGKGKKK